MIRQATFEGHHTTRWGGTSPGRRPGSSAPARSAGPRHLSRPRWPPATCHVPIGLLATCHVPTGWYRALKIGRQLAKKLQGLDMRVLGYDLFEKEGFKGEYAPLEEVLAGRCLLIPC